MDRDLFTNFANAEQAAAYVRDRFRWTSKDPSDPGPGPLPSNYHDLCPHFDLEVAGQYANESNLLDMVPAIFYAMVIDYATKLGLSCRLTMDVMIWAMKYGPCKSWTGALWKLGLGTTLLGSERPRSLAQPTLHLILCWRTVPLGGGRPPFLFSGTPCGQQSMLGTTFAGPRGRSRAFIRISSPGTSRSTAPSLITSWPCSLHMLPISLRWRKLSSMLY